MGWPVEGYNRLYYAGDTLLDDRLGQRLAEQHAEQSWGSSYVFQYHNPVAQITAVEDGVVFLWSTTLEAWDTLFWFGAAPGEHWQRPHVQFIVGNPTDRIEVVDTGTVLLDGLPLRTLDVEVICDQLPEFYTLTITERLGTSSVLNLPDGCAFDYFAWELRCYSDDEMAWNQIGPCDTFLNFSDHPASSSAGSPFPNPGTDHFVLPVSPDVHSVKLFDSTGRLVHRVRTGQEQVVVDTSELPSGIYFVHEDGMRASFRWIKE